MKTHRVAATMSIDAPAQKLYSILADYRIGHARILPRPPFLSMEVVRGGVGEGTRIHVKMRILGLTRTLHGVVSEPQPGRVLTERYEGTDLVTSFIVEPGADGRSARVTIATNSLVHGGLLGRIEGWLTTALLCSVYVRELGNLADLARASS